MTEGLTDQPGFWTAIVGATTALVGIVVGHKSRPLDKADTAERIGSAWDRIAVQLTTDNALLRSELAELKATEKECKQQLVHLEELAHQNVLRHDHLVDFLNKLGLAIPEDALPVGMGTRKRNSKRPPTEVEGRL